MKLKCTFTTTNKTWQGKMVCICVRLCVFDKKQIKMLTHIPFVGLVLLKMSKLRTQLLRSRVKKARNKLT